MIEKFKPSIVSLNELGTTVPTKAIERILFSYNVVQMKGLNKHGDVVIAVDKRLKTNAIELHHSNIVAVSIATPSKPFTITSVYSPPAEKISFEAMSDIIKQTSSNIIIGWCTLQY